MADFKKQESGAQKRKMHKLTEQRNQQLLKKIPKLTGYFKPADSNTCSAAANVNQLSEDASQSDGLQNGSKMCSADNQDSSNKTAKPSEQHCLKGEGEDASTSISLVAEPAVREQQSEEIDTASPDSGACFWRL
ncbi:hypothetical protein QQF64_007566 [Cirrhinus molitorella]|uniref:Uncharacterized protein n=1 Tax=Cirrhinus molitorella TaxID=172907 RepID=A0ABR3MDB4_9TELE